MLTCGGAATIKMMSSCALDNYAINGIHAHLRLGPISTATVAYSQCVVSMQPIHQQRSCEVSTGFMCKHSLSCSEVSQSTSPKFLSFNANV